MAEPDVLIGVANYVRSDDPARPRLPSPWHIQDHLRGVGDGTAATSRECGARQGNTDFAADILAENGLMLQVLRDAGWGCENRYGGSVLHVSIDLSIIKR